MDLEEKYQKIANLLWSIMPENASEILYRYMFYPDFNQGGAYSMDNNSEKIFFENPPLNVYQEISHNLEELSEYGIFGEESPNHFYITLNQNGEFKINFAYIPREDSWSTLYMKGISDLTWEEAYEYYIPKDIWEERVRIKNSKS